MYDIPQDNSARNSIDRNIPTYSNRFSTKKKRSAYSRIVCRDGEICSICNCEPQIIWRNFGVCVTDFRSGYLYSRVHPTSNLELDHKTPLCEGGGNDDDNLWLLCVDCHRKKTASENSKRLTGRKRRLFR